MRLDVQMKGENVERSMKINEVEMNASNNF